MHRGMSMSSFQIIQIVFNVLIVVIGFLIHADNTYLHNRVTKLTAMITGGKETDNAESD